MDQSTFNAKKSRAQKLKNDKRHSKRPPSKASNVKGKDSQENSSAKEEVKPPVPAENSKVESADKSGSESDSPSSSHQNQETEASDKAVKKIFSRRTITSNWNRYENEVGPIVPQVESETIGASFDDLINESLSGGSHLKLRHEYEWDKEKAELQSPWYRLNLQQLNQNISSIPFYIRQDLPSQLFTKEEIKHMQDRSRNFGSELVNNRILGSLGVRGKGATEQRGLEPEREKTQGSLSNCYNEHLPESQPHKTLDSRPRENNKNVLEPQGMEDGELDLLLALDKPLSSLVNSTAKSNLEIDGLKHLNLHEEKQIRGMPHVANSSKVVEVGGKDMNALSPVKPHPSLNPEGNCETRAQPGESATASLDDWLDSILDD